MPSAMTLPSLPEFTSEEVGLHYDRLDRVYRDLWGEHMHHGLWRTGKETPEQATRALVDVVAARAQLAPDMAVVDIGCGYGATARIFAREWHARVTGVTVSAAQFWYARGQAAPDEDNPNFVHGDWLGNTLPDASQDALIAIESVEHMADKAAVFREAARVLRPGGRLVVCAWTAAPSPSAWQRRSLLEPIRRGWRLATLARETDYADWMTRAGLSVTARDDVSRRVARTWSLCSRRLLAGLARDPRYLRLLFGGGGDGRSFAFSLPRLWLAYRSGALRYVIYTACRPPLG